MSGDHPTVNRVGLATVVTLGKEYNRLDGASVEDAALILITAAENAQPPVLILDLSHTRFFGSSFIEVLVRAWNVVRHRGQGKFMLVGVNGYCREVLQITHLNDVWPMYDSVGAAMEAIQAI